MFGAATMFSKSVRASRSCTNWKAWFFRRYSAAWKPTPKRTPAGSSARQISWNRRLWNSKFS